MPELNLAKRRAIEMSMTKSGWFCETCSVDLDYDEIMVHRTKLRCNHCGGLIIDFSRTKK